MQWQIMLNDFQLEVMLDLFYYVILDFMMQGDELGYSLLDEWNIMDWLEFDLLVFGLYMDVDVIIVWG